MTDLKRKEIEKRSALEKLEYLLDIRWLFIKVFKLWWLFFLVAILFAVGGYFFAKSIPVKYKSRLTFALDEGNSGSSGIISLASELGFNLNNGVNLFSGDNILSIIKSRHIVEDVLTSVDTFSGKPKTLIDEYLSTINYFSVQGKNKVTFPVNQPRDTYSYQQDSLLKIVYTDFANSFIKAERPDKRLSIYEINVTTQDEQLTKVFTDRLVAKSNDFYTTIKTQKSKQTLDILENRVASMKGNLNKSLSERAQAEDVNINPAFSKAQVPVLKQQSNMQVYGTAYSELFKNLELARFQFLNNMPLMQVIDKADYPMEKIRQGRLLTALIFGFVGVVFLFVIIWLRRIFAISKRMFN